MAIVTIRCEECFFYMEIHKKYIWLCLQVSQLKERKVRYAKLNKYLYRFTQSIRAWFDKFSCIVCWVKRCKVDHSIFIKHSHSRYIILAVYVNVSDHREWYGRHWQVQKFFDHHFHTKDLGYLRYFPKIKVARSKQGINIYQRKYIFSQKLDNLGRFTLLWILTSCQLMMGNY